MKKEIKEKIIEILNDWATDTESKTPTEKYADQILELFSQSQKSELEKVRKEIEKRKKGREAITGNWEHLLPNSEDYNQCLDDILQLFNEPK